MPLYQYRCSCGEGFESPESFSAVKKTCAEACVRAASDPQRGIGEVERVLSGTAIRGDGREAKQVVVDPCVRSNRPGGGCH